MKSLWAHTGSRAGFQPASSTGILPAIQAIYMSAYAIPKNLCSFVSIRGLNSVPIVAFGKNAILLWLFPSLLRSFVPLFLCCGSTDWMFHAHDCVLLRHPSTLNSNRSQLSLLTQSCAILRELTFS
jgi:hypothetical protein